MPDQHQPNEAKVFIRKHWIPLSMDNFVAARNAHIKTTERQREAQVILNDIGNHKVCFYPGAGHDSEPLSRLTHLCDTLIFCDCGVNAGEVTLDLGIPGLILDYVVNLNAETIAYLSDGAGLPGDILGRIAHSGVVQVAPWGKYARLSHTAGNTTDKVHVFYLGIEAVTAYFKLFTPAHAAPAAICLNLGMGHDPKLFDWEGALGELVRGCDHVPAYLVSARPDTWPYPKLMQALPGWLSIWTQNA